MSISNIENIINCDSFPNENPYPVLRADHNGNIIYKNRKATEIEVICVDEKEYSFQEYLIHILRDYKLQNNFEKEISSNGRHYNFIFCLAGQILFLANRKFLP